MSLRNTGWRRQTPKINLSKGDISPERLYHSRYRFSKADGKRRSFLEWKNLCFFHWSAENKTWPELLHWSAEDFLTGLNFVDIIRGVTLNSCKTVFRHTAQKWQQANDFRLQVYRTSKRQSKTNGRRSPLRQFGNPLHNEKTTECG